MQIQEPFHVDSSDSEEEAEKKQREILAQFPADVPEVYGSEEGDIDEEAEKYNYYYDEDEMPEEDLDHNSTAQNQNPSG